MNFIKPNVSLSSAKPRVVPGSERIVRITEGDKYGHLTDTFNCYFKFDAFKKMVVHCLEFSQERIEVMGFLLGDIYYRKDRKKIDSNFYTDITRVVPGGDLDASNISVKFTDRSFAGIFEQLEELEVNQIDYKILGWYHSHPGRDCYISKTDLRTITHTFNRPYNVSIVVDPVNREIKIFQLKENEVAEVRCLLYGK